MFFYLLRLENDKYYILFNPNEHFDINDVIIIHSDWLCMNRPIEIIDRIKYIGQTIDQVVVKYMNIYGVDSVRGGSYIDIRLSSKQKNNIDNYMTEIPLNIESIKQPKVNIFNCITRIFYKKNTN